MTHVALFCGRGRLSMLAANAWPSVSVALRLPAALVLADMLCRTAVVIKVHGPPSPTAWQQLQQQWLQQHALQLPDSIPFQLELAAHAESVDTLLVPSCCVLTSLGLSEVLPNAPEYVSAREVQQLVVRDVCEGGGCALWGSKPPVALGPGKSAARPAGEPTSSSLLAMACHC